MMTIHLKELHFYANHGWHENEAIVGNEFVVSLAIKIDLKKPVKHLEDTVDYVSAYNIVKKYLHKKSHP